MTTGKTAGFRYRVPDARGRPRKHDDWAVELPVEDKKLPETVKIVERLMLRSDYIHKFALFAYGKYGCADENGSMKDAFKGGFAVASAIVCGLFPRPEQTAENIEAVLKWLEDPPRSEFPPLRRGVCENRGPGNLQKSKPNI
ncbi:hypothetical protein P6U16_13550 [Rhizobium sp. 32-5/1]|uniref:hypothetical protein n=1 Tax=Rhizobium sp. 32-5/1 TaxID=3019602 RepID=UPI00240D73F1|nr:hypothetical protein [Rhizobium sp. 32-5/1]WEZ82201.1 hypothetical protein P6U16_13550 [Rhizobium sp. 32-5/1]